VAAESAAEEETRREAADTEDRKRMAEADAQTEGAENAPEPLDMTAEAVTETTDADIKAGGRMTAMKSRAVQRTAAAGAENPRKEEKPAASRNLTGKRIFREITRAEAR
jgi:hypothetical protein